MARKRLGEILIEAGAITDEQLKQALIEQRRWGRPLGRVLLDLHVVEEPVLVSALSTQLHIPIADVEKLAIEPEALDVMPAELAQQHNVLPMRIDKKALDVAMSDPTNLGIIDELRIRTRFDIQPHIAGPRALERAIRRWYVLGQHEDDGPGAADPATLDVDDTTQRMMLARNARVTGARPVTGAHPRVTGSVPTVGTAQVSQRITATRPTLPQVTKPSAPVPTLTVSELSLSLAERQREIESLQARLQAVEGLRRRDEDLIRQLCLLLMEKNVVTREEIVKRMNRAG